MICREIAVFFWRSTRGLLPLPSSSARRFPSRQRFVASHRVHLSLARDLGRPERSYTAGSQSKAWQKPEALKLRGSMKRRTLLGAAIAIAGCGLAIDERSPTSPSINSPTVLQPPSVGFRIEAKPRHQQRNGGNHDRDQIRGFADA